MTDLEWLKSYFPKVSQKQFDEIIDKEIEKQEKYKWHDLRKNPEDLPEDGQKVECQHLPNLITDKTELVIQHYFVDGMFVENWHMDTDFKSDTFGERYMGDVIAWREIEPFESEE